MKTSLVLIGVTALMAGSTFAGPEVIIKQRAKELRDQNNVRQGVAPPTQPVQPASAATVTPPPSPGLTKLQTDMAAIKANAPATPEQKRQLAKDLLFLAQGPIKPSQAAADKLAEDLAAALTEAPLPAAHRARFAQELDAVLNPGKYPQARLEAIYQDIQATFQANNLNRTKAAALSEQVKALTTSAK
ncbi:MAG TPA: hypothetical protein VNT26_14590 [Candidatus Sulfotelmatobacter sp.]|nr:hypothetical protein [Candidatus Sulfotelmatobacter sp.]HWI58547.1 hypothetical protein [Bacillota bacterium]